jgi:uroporphyrinogen-III synthase
MTRQPIYLLSTGDLPEGPVEEAAKAGIILDVVAFIKTEYREETGEMGQLSGRALVAVFTSVNAVAAVQRWMPGPTGWRVYCIGGATFEAVVALFGKAAVLGKARSAAGLAEVIRDREAGGSGEIGGGREIVFFCGDHRREELPSILRGAGFSVVEEVVYRTLPTPHKVERDYAGIAFFSPSAVESFFSVNAIATGVLLFAIGPTTAAAIRARCTNPVITGGEPDKAMLIRKMTDHFLNNR